MRDHLAEVALADRVRHRHLVANARSRVREARGIRHVRPADSDRQGSHITRPDLKHPTEDRELPLARSLRLSQQPQPSTELGRHDGAIGRAPVRRIDGWHASPGRKVFTDGAAGAAACNGHAEPTCAVPLGAAAAGVCPRNGLAPSCHRPRARRRPPKHQPVCSNRTLVRFTVDRIEFAMSVFKLMPPAEFGQRTHLATVSASFHRYGASRACRGASTPSKDDATQAVRSGRYGVVPDRGDQ